jgi:hypothetical protein
MESLINTFGTKIKAVVKPKNKEHQQELQNQRAYKRKDQAHKKIEGDIKNGTHKGEEDGAAREELLNSYLEPEAEEVFKNDTNKGEVRGEERDSRLELIKHDFDSQVDQPLLDIIKKDEEDKRKKDEEDKRKKDEEDKRKKDEDYSALDSGKTSNYIQPKGYQNSSNKGQNRDGSQI